MNTQTSSLYQTFSFSTRTKSTESTTKSLPQGRSQDWVFESVDCPSNYKQMISNRRSRSQLVQRNVGTNGYASHWVIETGTKGNSNKLSQGEHTSAKSSPTITEQLVYAAMFEALVGKTERNRIEKQYKMTQKNRTKKPREVLSISELC